MLLQDDKERKEARTIQDRNAALEEQTHTQGTTLPFATTGFHLLDPARKKAEREDLAIVQSSACLQEADGPHRLAFPYITP